MCLIVRGHYISIYYLYYLDFIFYISIFIARGHVLFRFGVDRSRVCVGMRVINRTCCRNHVSSRYFTHGAPAGVMRMCRQGLAIPVVVASGGGEALWGRTAGPGLVMWVERTASPLGFLLSHLGQRHVVV